MSTTRYYLSPWRELEQLGTRLPRGGNGLAATGAPRTADASWLPPISVEETRDALVLTAELPGVSPEQVELHVENGVLTLRGEKREARSEDGETRRYHLWERSYGSFTRAFTLPRGVRGEAISAEFDNGLLRVHLPKVAEAQSRKIPIGGNGGARGHAGPGEEERR